jgi:hypothetical protein
LHAKEFYVGCVCDGTLWQTFGPASIINIDLPSQVTDDEPYPTPLFPPDQYSKSPMQTSTPNSKVARPPSPAPSFGLQRAFSSTRSPRFTTSGFEQCCDWTRKAGSQLVNCVPEFTEVDDY